MCGGASVLAVGAGAALLQQLEAAEIPRSAQLPPLSCGMVEADPVHERLAEPDRLGDDLPVHGLRLDDPLGSRIHCVRGAGERRTGEDQESGEQSQRPHAASLRARARKKRTSASPWSSPACSSTESSSSLRKIRVRSARARATAAWKLRRTACEELSTNARCPVSGSSTSTSPREGNASSIGSRSTTGTTSCFSRAVR